MTVKQICDNSSKQLVIHGMLVIDKEFGAFFDIPESYEGVPCDDIDYVSQLPQNMVLNELHVKDREWWR